MRADILLEEFLETKEGDVPLTRDDFKEMRDFFVSKDVFQETQKSYVETLARIDDTLKIICAKDTNQEVRLVELEGRHEHDEECHQLTEAKIDRKIRLAVMRISAVLAVATILVTVVVPVVKAYIIPLLTQAPK